MSKCAWLRKGGRHQPRHMAATLGEVFESKVETADKAASRQERLKGGKPLLMSHQLEEIDCCVTRFGVLSVHRRRKLERGIDACEIALARLGLANGWRHLKTGGILGLWSNEPTDERYLERLAQAFPLARAEPATFHNLTTESPFAQSVYLVRNGARVEA